MTYFNVKPKPNIQFANLENPKLPKCHEQFTYMSNSHSYIYMAGMKDTVHFRFISRAEAWLFFFLGHNLLYCGLKQDILLSFVAFDKICRREMRAGAKLRFQHIFREMRASGAKKRDQSECKTDNSLRFQPHFLAPSNPFPVLFCVDISPASNSLYLAHTFFPLFLFLVIPLFFPFLIFCFLCSFTPFSRFCLIFLQICLTSLKDFEMSLKNFLIISLFVFWFVAWLFLPV